MNEIRIGDTFEIQGQEWQLVSTYITDANIFMFKFYNCKRMVFMNIRTEEFDKMVKPKSNI